MFFAPFDRVRLLAQSAFLAISLLALPSVARAQADDPDFDDVPAASKKKGKAAAKEKDGGRANRESAPEASPGVARATGSASADARFKIRRGFFAEGDLGVFLTFGGRNTNNPELPKRVTSNIQPQLGVTVGYDVAHGETYSFSLGLKLAMGLNGGAGRVSGTDPGDPTTKSNDYAVIQSGLQAALSILMTDRLALAFKLDGGAGIVDPDPTKTADDPSAGSATFAPVLGGGAGLEYFTLLNDFSVGVTLRFEAILLDGMIPGATVTIPIKYTF